MYHQKCTGCLKKNYLQSSSCVAIQNSAKWFIPFCIPKRLLIIVSISSIYHHYHHFLGGLTHYNSNWNKKVNDFSLQLWYLNFVYACSYSQVEFNKEWKKYPTIAFIKTNARNLCDNNTWYLQLERVVYTATRKGYGQFKTKTNQIDKSNHFKFLCQLYCSFVQ